MVDEFIKTYIKKIAAKPEYVNVTQSLDSDEKTYNIVIYASDVDVGRIIGKNGKMISSIKTVISGCKAKNGMSYKIIVESV